ncbi:MAG: ABC transporter permease [Ilumatobacteraceae bacterium]
MSTLGLAGFATVWAVTQLVFGVPWGDPFGVVVMMTCTVFAIAGSPPSCAARRAPRRRLTATTSMVAFALALLGGNFIGPGQAPETLRRIATFTPNGQAIDAFTRLAVDDAGPGDLARQIVVLVGFGVVFGALGLRRVSRLVTS